MIVGDTVLREGSLVWGTLRIVNKRGHVIEIYGQQVGSDSWKPIASFVSLGGKLAYTVYSKQGTAVQTGEVENASHEPNDT